MKEISQKVKPMDSENFQPQKTLHPQHCAIIMELGSGWRGPSFNSPLAGYLSWREMESLFYLVRAFVSGRMTKMVRPQAFSCFLSGSLRDLSLPPPDPGCGFMNGEANQATAAALSKCLKLIT